MRLPASGPTPGPVTAGKISHDIAEITSFLPTLPNRISQSMGKLSYPPAAPQSVRPSERAG